MSSIDWIEVPYLEVNQPLGTFYVVKMKYEDLLSISYSDVRSLNDSNKLDDYMGIQRKLSKNRVKEIKNYVNYVDAIFPNTIIVEIDSGKDVARKEDYENLEDYLNVIVENDVLRIRKEEKIAKVLDGYHRLSGFFEKNYSQASSFELIVSIFVDLDIEDQAIMFATINKAQTKVNKSLVADLFEYARNRSPQKTSHEVVRALNRAQESPFYQKIKILGTARKADLETIAQATFYECILKYITRNPEDDRDRIRRGKKLDRAEDEKDLRNLFLRNWFIDKEDVKIAELIKNYFLAVHEKWPTAWDGNTSNMILNKSTGLIALMRFFKDACHYLGFNNKVISVDEFTKLFDEIEIPEKNLNREEYIPGSGGQSKLYHDLKSFFPDMK